MSAHRQVDGIDITFLNADDDPTAFLAWIDQPHAMVGFDVETGGPDPINPFVAGFEVRLISFSDGSVSWVLDGTMIGPVTHALNAAHVFVAHHAGFDMLAARQVYGTVPRDVIDTYLLALMVFPPQSDPSEWDDEDDEGDDDEGDDDEGNKPLSVDDRHGLKPLSTRTGSCALADADEALHGWFAELEPRPPGGDASEAVKAWEGRCYATAPVDHSTYWIYNGLDAAFCPRVLRYLLSEWEGQPADILALLVNESRLGAMLTGVTWRGLRVDRRALGDLFQAAVDAQAALRPQFAELGVTNPASIVDVAAALEQLGVVNPAITDTGTIATDKSHGLPRLREPDQPAAPHSLFWDIDGLGYVFLNLATLFAVPAFEKRGLQRWVRSFFLANGLITPLFAIAYFYPTFSVPLLILGGAPWAITVPGCLLLLALFFRGSSAPIGHGPGGPERGQVASP